MKISMTGAWKPLAIPKKYADYINDHTVFIDGLGRVRLLGTCGKSPYIFFKETKFIEFVDKHEIKCLFDTIPNRLPKYAPFVFYHKQRKTYHLFFSSLGVIHHFFGSDGISWNYVGIAVKSIMPYLRDPFLLAFENTFYLYLTDFGNRIVVYESKDVMQFRFKGNVLQLGYGTRRSINSSCESPTVMKVHNGYLLFTTIVPSPFGRYAQYLETHVFYSENPFDFGYVEKGSNNTAHLVTILETHAPEIITLNNTLYITTCGWAGFPKPHGIPKEANGVFMRRLRIEE